LINLKNKGRPQGGLCYLIIFAVQITAMRLTASVTGSIILLIICATACKKPILPVSDAEAGRFALRLEKAAAKKDAATFDAAVDLDAFIGRIPVPENDKMKPEFRTIAEGWMRPGKEMIETLQPGDSYNFIRSYRVADTAHLIFRHKTMLGDVSYHDYTLCRRKDSCAIADIYFFGVGQHQSQSLAEMYKSTANHQEDGRLQFLEHLRYYVNNGQYEYAQRIMKQLPLYMCNTKYIRATAVEIASHQPAYDSTYKAAVEAFTAAYPEGNGTDIILLDSYIRQGKRDQGMSCIDQLNKKVQDPLLTQYRTTLMNLPQGN
jgi:hypothetical protein